MQPKQARGTFRKRITKPSEQVAAPPSTSSLQVSITFVSLTLLKDGERERLHLLPAGLLIVQLEVWGRGNALVLDHRILPDRDDLLVERRARHQVHHLETAQRAGDRDRRGDSGVDLGTER